MNFRTQVEMAGERTEIRHSDKLMLFGSCFTENIGKFLVENKFGCEVNPYGILYNPLSIAKALREIMVRKVYDESDLFEREYGIAGCIIALFHRTCHLGIVCRKSTVGCRLLQNVFRKQIGSL